MATTIKLGALLIKASLLTEAQLAAALSEQQRWGGKLGEILVRMSIINEDTLVRALGKQLNIPIAKIDEVQKIPPHVLAKIPRDVARDLTVLPLQLLEEGKTLVVAMSQPQNLDQIDKLRSLTRCKIIPQIAGVASISRAFARLFDSSADLSDNNDAFKMVDAQGNTMMKSIDEIKASHPSAPPPPASRPSSPNRPVFTPLAHSGPPMNAAASSGPSVADQVAQLIESHRREVASLKSVIELMIDKGYFTREEYLARMRK
jgi:hypothetical protein